MNKQSALALARRIEEETELYNVVPFVSHRFVDGEQLWSIACQDKSSGYVFQVDSPERWEYFKKVPPWNSDEIWEQG